MGPLADADRVFGRCKKDPGEVRLARGDRTAGRALLQEARHARVEAGIESGVPDTLRRTDDAHR